MRTPSGGEQRPRHARRGADSGRGQPPEILLKTLAEPIVHRPQSVARCREDSGASAPRESPGEPPKRRLVMGLSPPEAIEKD